MGKIIKEFVIDGDIMSIYNLIEELNSELNSYNLSIHIDHKEHDGYEVVILKEKKNKTIKID